MMKIPLKSDISKNQLKLLRSGHKETFNEVYLSYFKPLQRYAMQFTKEAEVAEEIIQQVFCRIWERRNQLKEDGLIKSFLYTSVYHACINYLKHEKIKQLHADQQTLPFEQQVGNLQEEVTANELQFQLQSAMEGLPPQCRIIFKMSRIDQLKYKEISSLLQISVKTVENQMGKALRILRKDLIDFLILLLTLLTTHHLCP